MANEPKQPQNLLPDGFGKKPNVKAMPHPLDSEERAMSNNPPEGRHTPIGEVGDNIALSREASDPLSTIVKVTNAIPGALFGKQRDIDDLLETGHITNALKDASVQAGKVLQTAFAANPDLQKMFHVSKQDPGGFIDLNNNSRADAREFQAHAIALDYLRTFSPAAYEDIANQIGSDQYMKVAQLAYKALENSATAPVQTNIVDAGKSAGAPQKLGR